MSEDVNRERVSKGNEKTGNSQSGKRNRKATTAAGRQRGRDSGLRVDCGTADHGTILLRKGEMIGKLAERFCGVFSAVYGESWLGGACGVGEDGAGGGSLPATLAFFVTSI